MEDGFEVETDCTCTTSELECAEFEEGYDENPIVVRLYSPSSESRDMDVEQVGKVAVKVKSGDVTTQGLKSSGVIVSNGGVEEIHPISSYESENAAASDSVSHSIPYYEEAGIEKSNNVPQEFELNQKSVDIMVQGYENGENDVTRHVHESGMRAEDVAEGRVRKGDDETTINDYIVKENEVENHLNRGKGQSFQGLSDGEEEREEKMCAGTGPMITKNTETVDHKEIISSQAAAIAELKSTIFNIEGSNYESIRSKEKWSEGEIFRLEKEKCDLAAQLRDKGEELLTFQKRYEEKKKKLETTTQALEEAKKANTDILMKMHGVEIKLQKKLVELEHTAREEKRQSGLVLSQAIEVRDKELAMLKGKVHIIRDCSSNHDLDLLWIFKTELIMIVILTIFSFHAESMSRQEEGYKLREKSQLDDYMKLKKELVDTEKKLTKVSTEKQLLVIFSTVSTSIIFDYTIFLI